MESRKQGERRRDFIRMLVALTIVLATPALLIRDIHVLKAAPSLLAPTPAIDDDDAPPAPVQTEVPERPRVRTSFV